MEETTVDTTSTQVVEDKKDVSFMYDTSLLGDIAFKADNAARNRRLRAYGYEALDVYNEVVVDILGKIDIFGSFDSMVADLVKGRVPAMKDPKAKEAISLALGKLCAAAAERIIYRAKNERPVGDATAVTGEEVPKEQRDVSPEEAARGNDKQMVAILARKGVSRGVHRADVYGVADWSRRAMQDNITRSMSEQDVELMADLLDNTDWLPETDSQREAWELAFGGQSVADVLFGMNLHDTVDLDQPDVEVPDWTDTPCVHRVVLRAKPGAGRLQPDKVAEVVTFTGEDVCYYHDKMAKGVIEPHQVGVLKPDVPVYPPSWPYKPLKLTTTGTTHDTPDPVKCRHCEQTDPNGPRRLSAQERYEAANPGKKYVPPKPTKKCPPGKVIQWRSLGLSATLPESATPATVANLHRAMANFAKYARTTLGQVHKDEAFQMVLNNDIRDMLEAEHRVGMGVPKVYETVRQSVTPLIFPEEADSSKDGRRWSIMPTAFGPDVLVNVGRLGSTDIYDAYTQTIANVLDGGGVPLPGAERWQGTMVDMAVGPILVSHHGDMMVDGVKGTFVDGLPGWVAWYDNVSMGRKMVNALVATRSVFAMMLAS